MKQGCGEREALAGWGGELGERDPRDSPVYIEISGEVSCVLRFDYMLLVFFFFCHCHGNKVTLVNYIPPVARQDALQRQKRQDQDLSCSRKRAGRCVSFRNRHSVAGFLSGIHQIPWPDGETVS